MRFLSFRGLLGVESAVIVRVQSGTNVKNNESWEKALFERANCLVGAKGADDRAINRGPAFNSAPRAISRIAVTDAVVHPRWAAGATAPGVPHALSAG